MAWHDLEDLESRGLIVARVAGKFPTYIAIAAAWAVTKGGNRGHRPRPGSQEQPRKGRKGESRTGLRQALTRAEVTFRNRGTR